MTYLPQFHDSSKDRTHKISLASLFQLQLSNRIIVHLRESWHEYLLLRNPNTSPALFTFVSKQPEIYPTANTDEIFGCLATEGLFTLAAGLKNLVDRLHQISFSIARIHWPLTFLEFISLDSISL